MTADVPATGYKDLILFLATAGVVVPLFKRLRISPILGFLGAGVALGPFGLGALAVHHPWLSTITVSQPQEITGLGEFGVVFLLFMIGLGLSWERLRLLRRLMLYLGPMQVLISAGVLAAMAGLLGASLPAALVVGLALALSSTAVIVPVLVEHHRLHSQAGRAILAVLLFQDLMVAPILVTVTILGRARDHGFSPQLLLAFLPAALAVAALAVVGRLLLRPMFKSVARARSEELFMAACLLVVIGAGLVSAMAGLSMAIGAFIAGLLLAETEYRHQVEVTIEPFKGLLLGLFFVSVGTGLDLSRLAAHPLLILGLATGLLLLKGGVTYGAARLMALKASAAIETSLALAAGGEFAFVLIGAAVASGLAPAHMGASVTLAATLSMVAIPGLGAIGARIARRVKPASVAELPPLERPLPPRVLVIGYGRVGRLVGEMLTTHRIDWVSVDRNAHEAEAARRKGLSVFYGDATRLELLRRLGLDTARALVVTMDAPEAAEAVVAAARQIRPDLIIIVRARDARGAQRLYELGATDAVPETIEASLQLSEAVLVEIGVPMGLVIASIHQQRDDYRRLLNVGPSSASARRRDATNRRPT